MTSRPVQSRSRFIVVEGPNGVGKTAVARALAERLRRNGQPVAETREPSDTDLGRAIRDLERSLPPMALALACAADRFDHIVREIEPALQSGATVVCDRFLPSSLVLQRLDGLSLEGIWRLNSGIRAPDVTVFLLGSPDTLRNRLASRPRRSRFEESSNSEIELAFYEDARAFLTEQGWRVLRISTDGREPEEVAADIAEQLGGQSPHT